MKKIAMLLVLLALSAQYAGAEMSPDEARKAHREEMKTVKQTLRNNPKPESEKENTFWHREWKRSGFSERFNGESSKSFVKNLNPVPFFKAQSEKYNERKAAAVGK